MQRHSRRALRRRKNDLTGVARHVISPQAQPPSPDFCQAASVRLTAGAKMPMVAKEKALSGCQMYTWPYKEYSHSWERALIGLAYAEQLCSHVPILRCVGATRRRRTPCPVVRCSSILRPCKGYEEFPIAWLPLLLTCRSAVYTTCLPHRCSREADLASMLP